MHYSNFFIYFLNYSIFFNLFFLFLSKLYFDLFGNNQINRLNLYQQNDINMRNSIEKDGYRFLFGILIFFGLVLAIISTLLYIDLRGFAPKTLSVSSSLLFLLIGVSLWLRTEYLKLYNINQYQTKRIPMWFSAGAFILVGIFILV